MSMNIRSTALAHYGHKAVAVVLATCFWWIPFGLHRLWMRQPYWWLHTVLFGLSALMTNRWFVLNAPVFVRVYEETGRVLPHLAEFTNYWLLVPNVAWFVFIIADCLLVWFWPVPSKPIKTVTEASA